MQTVDEKPIETIHLYVVREEEPKPPLLPVVLSVLSLVVLVILCVFSPLRQPVREVAFRVPAVFLPVQTFTTSVAIIPTGKKTYPATTAQGILTVTNGSVISQELPKGLIFTGSTGREVVTDTAVFVPAGNANGFGFATVPAHAVVTGKIGNVPALSIDRVEGSSLYIRNLTAFQGGKDSYTVSLQLPQDKQTALGKARVVLFYRITHGLLAYPCKEVVNNEIKVVKLVVMWSCQFFTYSVSPLVQVTHVRLSGKHVFVDGFIVERPRPFTGK